jgi:membrane associated rhomboid family serine protease
MECGLAAVVTAVAVFVLGASPWAFALLGVCAFTMAPALVIVDRIERRR